MKKIIFILLFIPLVSFGQNEKTVNLNVKSENIKNSKGFSYLGNGVYTIEVSPTLFTSKSRVEKKLLIKVKEISSNINANYKIVNKTTKKNYLDQRGGVATFELRDEINNQLLISKKEAKKEILELKEFLELGIITQSEFDKKVAFLKKILLGN